MPHEHTWKHAAGGGGQGRSVKYLKCDCGARKSVEVIEPTTPLRRWSDHSHEDRRRTATTTVYKHTRAGDHGQIRTHERKMITPRPGFRYRVGDADFHTHRRKDDKW